MTDMTAEDLRPEREAAFSEQCLGMNDGLRRYPHYYVSLFPGGVESA